MPVFPAKRIAGLLVALCSLTAGSCGTDSQADSPHENDTPLTLPVVQLAARDTVLTHDYVADIQAVRNVEMRARMPGYLEKIYVDEGAHVKKGQPIFKINDAEYRTRLARARAALNDARAQARVAGLQLKQVKLLTDNDIISKTELDVARAKVKSAESDVVAARANVTNAERLLSYTAIRAPFDGVVNRQPIKVGSLVDEGTLLTSISDASEVFAYFNVSEDEYLEYRKTRLRDSARSTNLVHLILADGMLYPQPGKIETVESEFQSTTGSIAFRARFENPQGLLRHGATGKVRLTNTLPDAVLLPQKAVFEVQDKNYVYVVARGRVVRQSFEPQTRLASFYVVKSGLKPGTTVVSEGIQDLRDGARITPRPVSLNSALGR